MRLIAFALMMTGVDGDSNASKQTSVCTVSQRSSWNAAECWSQ